MRAVLNHKGVVVQITPQVFNSVRKRGRPRFPIETGGKLSGSSGRELRKVLVVDDERDLADLAEVLLSSHGIEVRVAYSAVEALLILESDPGIDAVFSDVMMPDMTGLQLASRIGALYPQLQVVLTSGYTPSALLSERDRSYPYVTKPYSIDAVISLLKGKPGR
jgi:DNA-binding NtrC family response regulator